MAALEWQIRDYWNADNPNPGGTPAVVTYVSYHTGKFGERVIRIDQSSPSQSKVEASIAQDIQNLEKWIGLKGTV